MGKIYVGDEGTEIIIAVKDDLSDLIEAKMFVKKPNGDIATWEATLKTDWENDPDYNPKYPYAIHYFTQEGDLSCKGAYKIQGWVRLPTWKGRIDTVTMIVHDWFE